MNEAVLRLQWRAKPLHLLDGRVDFFMEKEFRRLGKRLIFLDIEYAI